MEEHFTTRAVVSQRQSWSPTDLSIGENKKLVAYISSKGCLEDASGFQIHSWLRPSFNVLCQMIWI